MIGTTITTIDDNDSGNDKPPKMGHFHNHQVHLPRIVEEDNEKRRMDLQSQTRQQGDTEGEMKEATTIHRDGRVGIDIASSSSSASADCSNPVSGSSTSPSIPKPTILRHGDYCHHHLMTSSSSGNPRHYSLPASLSFFFFKLLLVLVVFNDVSNSETHSNSNLLFVNGQGLGGEIAFFKTKQMTPNITHRQNVCERYEMFRNGTIELKDALSGLQLNVLMGNYQGAYFNYNSETGINKDNPGLTAVILDELSRRSKFTWRNSFGVFYDPQGSEYNETWTDLLVWGTDTYDINIDWWSKNLIRMNLGIAFLREWYDSSIILITKKQPITISNKVVFWNWTRPYEPSVWYLTIFTIILSGICYQIIEYFGNNRQIPEHYKTKRTTHWTWFTENVYLSAINFPQNYEYEPKTFAGRLFGISISLWALGKSSVLVATVFMYRIWLLIYCANSKRGGSVWI